ncbi:hypothetical protein COOONC_00617 [Cooperia oncophora]
MDHDCVPAMYAEELNRHVYKKACEAWAAQHLSLMVMHTLHPKSLGYYASFIACMACVLRESRSRCFTASLKKKTEAHYLKIFDELKANIESGCNSCLKTFPRASSGGLCFHLAQEWNRKRDQLGLRKYNARIRKDERVAECEQQIKGVVFLPVHYCGKVGLFEDRRSSGGSMKNVQNFSAIFLQMAPSPLRICGANGKRLGILMGVHHPPLSCLIEGLRKLNYEARATLKRLEEDPTMPECCKGVIRKKDRNSRRNEKRESSA